MDPQLKYAGEAVFLVGIAYRLLRWALGAVREGDVAPSAFPTDLREAAGSFHLKGWRWWIKVILPGIFPYYITGAITASGGSWNASIVAEVASWGDTHLMANGLGAYIALATEAGDFPRVVLGITVMCVLVTLFNRLLWRPLYAFGERRLRLG